MTRQNFMQGEYDPPVPTRIVFGNRKTDSLKEEIKKLGGKRALILSGRSVAVSYTHLTLPTNREV